MGYVSNEFALNVPSAQSSPTAACVVSTLVATFLSRESIYTMSFLLAWIFCALSSGLTLYTMPTRLSDTDELE